MEAKTKAESRGEVAPVVAGAKVPEAMPDALRYMGDGRLYFYEAPRHHSFRDVVRPGYFTTLFRGNDRSYYGALIFATVKDGKKDPEDWTTVLLRLCQISGAAGVAPTEPTKVGILARWKCTIVAHDGEQQEEPRAA